MITTNYTDLRTNLKSYLDRVVENNEPLIVHRSGNESVVVISLDDYNATMETEYITKSPVMMDIIRQGDKDIADGKGIEFDINSIR